MKVIIAGTRSGTTREGTVFGFTYEQVERFMDTFSHIKIDEVCSGMARGPDRFGERWAKKHNIPIRQFPANWHVHRRSAGIIRNEQMALYSDFLVAFWDGFSKGTRDMIMRMVNKDKPYVICNLEGKVSEQKDDVQEDEHLLKSLDRKDKPYSWAPMGRKGKYD